MNTGFVLERHSVPAVKIGRILLPTDFSEASRQAIPYATAMAREFGAAITLVYVVPTHLPAEFGHLGLVLEAKRLAAEAKRALEEFRQRELPAELPVDTLLLEGGPPVQIGNAARTVEADLTVLSTHGYSGFKHAWMGSTAERVVRHAPCPVMSIRCGAVPMRFPDDGRFCFKRILVPTDFSATSDKAMVYAAALGSRCDATYRLLHVLEPPPYPQFGYAHVPTKEAGLKSEAFERLEADGRRQLGPLFPRAEKCVRCGRASFEIAAEARESNCDLIVVGTHGHSVLKHLLMGSTAEEVIRHAACPVLIVRDREHEFIGD